MTSPKNKKVNYAFVASPPFAKKIDELLEKMQKECPITISRSGLIQVLFEIMIEIRPNINYDDVYSLPSLAEAIKEAIQEKEKTS